MILTNVRTRAKYKIQTLNNLYLIIPTIGKVWNFKLHEVKSCAYFNFWINYSKEYIYIIWCTRITGRYATFLLNNMAGSILSFQLSIPILTHVFLVAAKGLHPNTVANPWNQKLFRIPLVSSFPISFPSLS